MAQCRTLHTRTCAMRTLFRTSFSSFSQQDWHWCHAPGRHRLHCGSMLQARPGHLSEARTFSVYSGTCDPNHSDIHLSGHNTTQFLSFVLRFVGPKCSLFSESITHPQFRTGNKLVSGALLILISIHVGETAVRCASLNRHETARVLVGVGDFIVEVSTTGSVVWHRFHSQHVRVSDIRLPKHDTSF